MSEVIVRMEMPINCEHCPMSHWNKQNELTGCDAVGGKRYVSSEDEFWCVPRPPWCPIVCELPEHGDLIDRDELKKHKRHSEEFCENIVSVAHIDWMPTIVPATERSET